MARLFAPRKEEKQSEKDIVVFYHADCTDGFTAAWVAWKKFGTKAKYIPYIYDDKLPELQGKRIYTLDVTFSDAVAKKLIRDQNQLTSIDHHVSTKDLTLATYQPSYALHHSGCVLAWQYFFPDRPIPKFLLYVQDVDLWTKKIKSSATLYDYLEMFDYSFKNWSKVIREFEDPSKRKKMLDIGALLQKHEDEMIKYDIEKFARLVNFDGHKIYAINSTRSASPIAAKLSQIQPPFALVWKQFKDGMVGVSLRGNGQVDCSKLAAKYGGGGHHNSAAFRLPSLAAIPWKAVK